MSNLSRKIVAVGLTLTTAVWFAGSIVPAAAASLTDAQVQAIVSLLQSFGADASTISNVQASLTGGTPVSTGSTASTSFTRDLTVGSKGTDVTALQQVLISGGYLKIAAPTAYFGSATKAALASWQAAKSISPAVGYFGKISRAAMGSVSTGTTTPGTTGPVVVVPSGSDLVVSLASDTPGALVIGSGTAFNRALKVSLTAGSKTVNVTGVTLSKSGFVANTNLNGVDVIDAAGVRHGNVITSINADNTIGITFASAPITVPAGQSTSLTVRFNLLTGNLSGTVGFSIAAASAITADTTAISGSFPITGNLMQIVNGGSSLASTTLDVRTDVGSSTSMSVDPASEQDITKFRIQETTSNEGVKLYSLTIYNQGSGADTDVKDLQLVDQAGNILATAQQVGKYVNFVLTTPFLIDKGQTKDFTVRAKVVDGAARTLNYVVYNNYDIDLRGVSTLVSVIPGVGANDTSFPIGNGFNIQTVGSGALTQTKASDSPSTAVVPGSTNVVLAKYTVKPTGENYELRHVNFWIATSVTAGAVALTGTVYVKVNDAIVYSTAASNIPVAAAADYALSSYPVIASGQNSTITIEGSINSAATTVSTYLVRQFFIASAKRLTTNDIVTNPTAGTDGNTISVKAAALAVTTLATPVAGSVVVGTSQFEYATIKLDASTGGEDVKVSRIIVTGAANTAVQNFNLYKDSDTSPLTTTASTATNAALITFNFSQPFTVTRATPVTLHLKADAVSGAAAHTFLITTSTSAVTAVGAVTGNTLVSGTDISFAGTGQAQTHVPAGSLTIALADGSPTLNQVVSVGTTQKELFAFSLTSRYEAQKITKIKVYASSTVGGLATTTLQNVSFYEGTNASPFASNVTPVCQDNAVLAPTGTWCTYTYQGSDNVLSAPVPVAGGTTIHVKADIGAGGTARLGDNFKFMIVSSTDSINVKGAVTGLTTGTVTGTPTANGTTFVASGPVTISADNTYLDTTVNTGAGMYAGIFKITNNSGATIRLSTSTAFVLNQSGSATSSFTLYVGDSVAGATTQLSNNHPTSVSSLVSFDIATSSATTARQITNGATKYLVIKNVEVTASGSTWAFSDATLGQVLYQVDESSLGYDTDPYAAPTDLSGVAQNLYVGLDPTSGPANSIISVNSTY